MRIVAGTHRSRVINAVEGNQTRPTTDKIKEAIFSRIGPYFEEGNMLDLFAGSGNMSFEAISRGMKSAVLCDVNTKAIKTIQQNCRSLHMEECCEIWRIDYHQALKRVKELSYTFDFVYLDPPYKKQQIAEILQYLMDHCLLNEGADVVCESLKEDEFEDTYGSLVKLKDVTYGITRITYYQNRGVM